MQLEALGPLFSLFFFSHPSALATYFTEPRPRHLSPEISITPSLLGRSAESRP